MFNEELPPRIILVTVRTPKGIVRVTEDSFYDGLTSGPWREKLNGPRNADGSYRKRAEVEFD